jgi:hypothetical protein
MGSDSRASDLDIQAQDASGNVLATATGGGNTDANDTETIIIPAVAGQVYFLRVFAQPTTLLPTENHYSLSIVNTAAPVPFGIALAPGSDTGQDAHDNVTNDNTPTVRLQVDLAALSGLSLSPQNGTPQLSDDAPGYKVGVYADGALAGFATPAGGGSSSSPSPRPWRMACNRSRPRYLSSTARCPTTPSARVASRAPS